MIDLGTPRPPQWTGRAPQVSTLDLRILEEFRKIWILEIENLYYNVRVGKGVEPPPETPPQFAKMQIQNSQRRIDTVVKFTNDPILYICEIRPHAGPGSLGNALTNTALFQADDQRPAAPAIITDHLAQDMEHVLKKYDVKLFQTFQTRVE